MSTTTLYSDGNHQNLLLEDFSSGLAVQANQHVIVHGNEALILDPGGHKVYPKVLSAMSASIGRAKLRHIFLSHQDPDVVAATNGWLMTTDAVAWCSALWVRFVPHFGLDTFVEDRLKPIPDEGMVLNLGGAELWILPAHFLHSCGNFQIYDPTSRILYSGDLGVSMGTDYREVTNFDDHIPTMEAFHRRYMAGNHALKLWTKMVRELDIDIIAPQHGAYFRGEMVQRFIEWCEGLECGLDLIGHLYKAPHRSTAR